MAFSGFARNHWIMIPDDTSVEEFYHVGNITPSKDLELKHLIMRLFKAGDIGSVQNSLFITTDRPPNDRSSETNISDSILSNSVAFESAVADITDSNYWLGDIRFDFSGANLGSGVTYAVYVNQTGFTRNADVDYYGWAYDWPAPSAVNTHGHNLIRQVIGNRR